jgi:2-polyprenyl-6-methoxyphenol hydroxylase-like FAD-dependent oxidoreductase
LSALVRKIIDMRREKALKRERTHAVVIGASVAGMLAARVLAEFFEQVTVLDRDSLPDSAESRPGVSQARHLHALLPRGRRILERYFAGITVELQAAGAELLDAANDIAWLTAYGWGVRFASEFEALSCTRDLLDSIIRAKLKQLPNVEILQGCDVTGLVGEPKGVEGVRLKLRDERMAFVNETLWANLVVATTGRNSAVPNWLKDLGLPEPDVDCVNAHVGYASRMFRRRENCRGDWRAMFIQAAPPAAKRAGILFPMERNRWLVTLQGGDHDYPPTDDAGFLEFARSLRSPMLYEAIADAESLTPISSYRATENRLRHYERLKTWPERFLVMGDAVCAFNPVYGQGMTTAALAAENLRECLMEQSSTLNGLARRFQKRLAQINTAPWMLATSEDLRYGGTEGAVASRSTKFMHNYIARVLCSATRNSSVRKRFLEVQGMLRGPKTIFRPSVVVQVLKQILWSDSNATAQPSLLPLNEIKI